MFNIPINHKTIFLFDHCNYFSNVCGQTYEYDVANKPKPSTASQQPNIKLNPLNKSLWTVNVEAALEYSRIVYDLFPEDKLIRLMISKSENTLNSWSDQEQGLDHLMNVMGSVLPPFPHKRQLFEGEEFINVCKALNISVNSIAQISQLQKNLCIETNSMDLVPNSGRIILFTSTKIRNIEQIQEFLKKSIDECNKNIEQIHKMEKPGTVQCLKIKMIELVIIDVVPFDQNLNFDKEIVKQNSAELRTRMVGSKSGSNLPNKLIQLATEFYGLSITSVTNIPMKEELNANSSANYDVDILHVKSSHDQLKICGLLKSCQKDGTNNAICLKWSNPKTNITEFNFSSQPFRITPIDVNSRPSLCLTGFLLGGRCVVLEVPRSNNSSNTRISSHVLCNHGNELFMHCLNITGKSNLEDRTSIESLNENLDDYRKSEFIDLIKENMLSSSLKLLDDHRKVKFSNKQSLSKIEKATKNWPLTYLDSFAININQLKPLLKIITQEQIDDIQYNECIRCLEFLNKCTKSEPITKLSIITSSSRAKLPLGSNENCYQIIWRDMEKLIKPYQDLSPRHKTIWTLILTLNPNRDSNNKMELDDDDILPAKNKREDDTDHKLENEKLSKRKKFPKNVNILADDSIKSVLDYWSKILNEDCKSRLEFYGRKSNPNVQVVPLYTNLKLDENQPTKGGAKIEIS